MHPLLLKADFDPFQMAIIVIAVFAGFVKWLWDAWQQKGGGPPAPKPPDPEEQRLRETAWHRQTGQSAAPPPLPPVVAPTAWDELRKAWKELQEAAKPNPPPAQRTPPPIPAQRRNSVGRELQTPRQPQVSRSTAAPASASARSVAATLGVQKPAVAAPVQAPVSAAVSALPLESPVATASSKATAAAGSALAGLLNLRRDPALMRQAILLQEILGPPKALQSSGDFVN